MLSVKHYRKTFGSRPFSSYMLLWDLLVDVSEMSRNGGYRFDKLSWNLLSVTSKWTHTHTHSPLAGKYCHNDYVLWYEMSFSLNILPFCWHLWELWEAEKNSRLEQCPRKSRIIWAFARMFNRGEAFHAFSYS